MVVVPSGYEVGELAKKYFFASLCARPNLARREIERGATPLTDRDILTKAWLDIPDYQQCEILEQTQ